MSSKFICSILTFHLHIVMFHLYLGELPYDEDLESSDYELDSSDDVRNLLRVSGSCRGLRPRRCDKKAGCEWRNGKCSRSSGGNSGGEEESGGKIKVPNRRDAPSTPNGWTKERTRTKMNGRSLHSHIGCGCMIKTYFGGWYCLCI